MLQAKDLHPVKSATNSGGNLCTHSVKLALDPKGGHIGRLYFSEIKCLLVAVADCEDFVMLATVVSR